MKKFVLTLMLFFLGSAAHAAVITLDFEDLSGSGILDSNYAGLTWDSNWVHYDSAQPPYNPSSGSSRIYTHNYGGWIDFGQDVTFLGSWVASLDVGQEMYWEGYNDGAKIFESDHLFGGVQEWLNLSWSGVDYVKFVSTSYNYFILDDISYSTNELSPVPVPAAAWLFGSALLGFIGFRRRMKKTSVH